LTVLTRCPLTRILALVIASNVSAGEGISAFHNS
jgi:hypothetical protein